MVITVDSDSTDPGSIPGTTLFFASLGFSEAFYIHTIIWPIMTLITLWDLALGFFFRYILGVDFLLGYGGQLRRDITANVPIDVILLYIPCYTIYPTYCT